MHVLMTGATGLIGSEVGKLLVQNGHEVTVLVRDPARAKANLPFPCRIYKWADANSPIPPDALTPIEAVINLAGENISERWTPERKKRIYDSRIEGTRHLVEALHTSAPLLKVFISGSAIGAYGDRADEVLRETSAFGTGFLPELVRDWEKAAEGIRQGEKAQSIRVAMVRTGIVLARKDGALAKLLPIFNKGLGSSLGDGQQWMSWIHLKDIARIFLFALENQNVSGSINGVAPNPVSNLEFTKSLAGVLHKPKFLPVPKIALRLALGEMSTIALGSQRVSADHLQALGFQFSFTSLREALLDLTVAERAGDHEMAAEQWVDKPVEEVFEFFSNEKNLEELTPPFLNFNIVGKSPGPIQSGTLIDYKLKIHGVSLVWQTRIDEWNVNQKFVDTQLKGPYRKWHHTHTFEKLGSGTLLKDRVFYRLPLGAIGNALAGWRVVGDVSEIFAYRRKKIGEMFG
jgi:uncharacterized protein (TIGR01777 family)